MKILLVNCPTRLDAPPVTFPTGLGIIARLIKDNGFDMEVLDANALRMGPPDVLKVIHEKKPDIVALSGMITTYGFQKDVSRGIDKGVVYKVISGGSLATSIPELALEKTGIDICVLGEGEDIVVPLLNTLKNKEPLENVPGICFRNKDGKVVTTEPPPLISDLDSVPFPAYDLFPTELYLVNRIWNIPAERSMNLISSRGCPFNCKFCYHIFGRSRIRFRSAENIIEEIKLIKSAYGVDFIAFADDNFIANQDRLSKFCSLIKDVDIPWGCHGRVDKVNDEMLKEMSDARCIWLGFGIESGSQAILDRMNKKVKVEQATKAISMTRKAGIYPNTTFIIGYPGENFKTYDETIDFCVENEIFWMSPFFITPYPGTPLYEEVKDRDELKNPEDFILKLNNAYDFTINLSELSDRELISLRNATSRKIFFRYFKKHPIRFIGRLISKLKHRISSIF